MNTHDSVNNYSFINLQVVDSIYGGVAALTAPVANGIQFNVLNGLNNSWLNETINQTACVGISLQ